MARYPLNQPALVGFEQASASRQGRRSGSANGQGPQPRYRAGPTDYLSWRRWQELDGLGAGQLPLALLGGEFRLQLYQQEFAVAAPVAALHFGLDGVLFRGVATGLGRVLVGDCLGGVMTFVFRVRRQAQPFQAHARAVDALQRQSYAYQQQVSGQDRGQLLDERT